MAFYKVQDPSGAVHTIEGPEGASEDEVIQQAQALLGYSPSSGETPSLGQAALQGAVNNLPFGGQLGALYEDLKNNEGYSKGLEDWNQQIAADKESHPVAYGAGAVTGSVAPFLLPGVGDAIEAAPVLGSAAIGAANAVGNEDLSQTATNPNIAKEAVLGGTLGALIGKVMPTGSATNEALENAANKNASLSVGYLPGQLGESQGAYLERGDMIHNLGLDQGNIYQRSEIANDLLGQAGKQIEDLGAGSRPLENPKPFINDLQEKLKGSEGVYGELSNPEVGIYRQAIANFQKPMTTGEPLTFQDLQNLKNAVAERAFNEKGEVTNQAAKNVYFTLRDAMKSIVDQSPEEYQDAMNNYANLSDIASGLNRQLKLYQSKGLTGVGMGGFGYVGRLLSMVNANPKTTALLGAAVTPFHSFIGVPTMLSPLLNPVAASELERGAMNVAPSLIKGATGMATQAAGTASGQMVNSIMDRLQTDPQSFGRYSQPLMNAAQTGGSQAVAATHFLLSQTYPDYNERFMSGENKKGEEQ